MDIDASRVGHVHSVGSRERASAPEVASSGVRVSRRVGGRGLVPSVVLLHRYIEDLGGDAIVNDTKLVGFLIHDAVLGERGGGQCQHHGQHRHQHHHLAVGV